MLKLRLKTEEQKVEEVKVETRTKFVALRAEAMMKAEARIADGTLKRSDLGSYLRGYMHHKFEEIANEKVRSKRFAKCDTGDDQEEQSSRRSAPKHSRRSRISYTKFDSSDGEAE
jgi:hypothetical protein